MKNILALSLILLFGCSTNQSPSAEVESSVSSVNETTNITKSKPLSDMKISRECPNMQCSSYVIKISGNELSIDINNQVIDMKLSQAQIKSLADIIVALKLRAMNTKITPGEKKCQAYSTDQQSHFLSLDKGGFAQTLRIYDGCHHLEQPYKQLIQWADKTAGRINQS